MIPAIFQRDFRPFTWMNTYWGKGNTQAFGGLLDITVQVEIEGSATIAPLPRANEGQVLNGILILVLLTVGPLCSQTQ